MDKDIYLVGTSDGQSFDVIAAWSDAEDAQAVADEYNHTKPFYDEPADVITVALHASGVRTRLIECSQRSDDNEIVDPNDLILPPLRENVLTVVYKVIEDVETLIPNTDLSVRHLGLSKPWEMKRLRDGKILQQWFLPPEGHLSYESNVWENPWYLDASIESKIAHFDYLFYWTLSQITVLSDFLTLIAIRRWLADLLCAEFHATIRTLAD